MAKAKGEISVSPTEVPVGGTIEIRVEGEPPKGTPKTGDPTWWANIWAGGMRIGSRQLDPARPTSFTIPDDPRLHDVTGRVDLVTSHDLRTVIDSADFKITS